MKKVVKILGAILLLGLIIGSSGCQNRQVTKLIRTESSTSTAVDIEEVNESSDQKATNSVDQSVESAVIEINTTKQAVNLQEKPLTQSEQEDKISETSEVEGKTTEQSLTADIKEAEPIDTGKNIEINEAVTLTPVAIIQSDNSMDDPEKTAVLLEIEKLLDDTLNMLETVDQEITPENLSVE